MTWNERKNLANQGFRFIRSDHFKLVIKVQSSGEYGHGWKILERGFSSREALDLRMAELLKDGKTIED